MTTVRTLLASSRLVTLTGPGGVGKTRLAVETAAQQAWGSRTGPGWSNWPRKPGKPMWPNSPPPRWACVTAPPARPAGRLARGRPGTAADAAGARQLRAPDRAGRRARRPAAARGARVRILATSQEPLAIDGEQLWEVPQFELPGPEDGEATVVARAGAVRLFVARAAAAAPGFTLDGDNARAVAAICGGLTGFRSRWSWPRPGYAPSACTRWPPGWTTGSGC